MEWRKTERIENGDSFDEDPLWLCSQKDKERQTDEVLSIRRGSRPEGNEMGRRTPQRK